MSIVQSKAIKAAIWSVLERLSTQIIGLVLGIILARLLSPYDYGVVGLTTIFIAISNVFVDSGFGNALVRKTDRSEDDLSTAFIFNIVIGGIVYILLFLISPMIASYFEEPELAALIRIIALTVIFNSLCIVQNSILTSQLNIRLLTIVNVCAQIPSGIIAVFLAYYHFGVYALAIQTVISSLLRTVLLWFYGSWWPRASFSWKSFAYLWGFGSKLLVASVIGAVFDKIYNVLIGKFVGRVELGYFTKATQLQGNVDGITTGVVAKMALPVLASYQSDRIKLSEKYRDIMKLLVMIVSPLTASLCFSSENIIILLWSEKWIDSAILFKFLIVGAMFLPIAQLSLMLLQVVERTDLILALEFPKKTIYALFIAIGFAYGVKGLCVAIIAINIAAALINMLATRRIICYSYIHQLGDLLKYMVVAFFSASISLLIPLSASNLVNIIIIFSITMLVYCFILTLVRDKMIYRGIASLKNSVLKF